MRSPTSCYLKALAVFDIIVLVSMVLCFSLPIYSQVTRQMTWYVDIYPYINPYAYPTALIAQTCSIYITVAFTVERYIAVCHPMETSKLGTISRARKSVFIIIICCVVYNIPRMLEFKEKIYFDPKTNRTMSYTLRDNPAFRHVYFIYMYICVMFVIPSCILAILNSLLIRAVKLSQTTQGLICSTSKGTVRRENNLTIMLISVIFVFLICQMPSIADNICFATLETIQLRTFPFVILTTMSTLMVITNSAANFYLYCLFGKKFRRVFCQLFCRCYLILARQDPDESFAHISTVKTGSRRGQAHGQGTSRKKYSGMMVVMNDDCARGAGRTPVTTTATVNGSAAKYTKMKKQTKL